MARQGVDTTTLGRWHENHTHSADAQVVTFHATPSDDERTDG